MSFQRQKNTFPLNKECIYFKNQLIINRCYLNYYTNNARINDYSSLYRSNKIYYTNYQEDDDFFYMIAPITKEKYINIPTFSRRIRHSVFKKKIYESVSLQLKFEKKQNQILIHPLTHINENFELILIHKKTFDIFHFNIHKNQHSISCPIID
jgi:hypothetical protein